MAAPTPTAPTTASTTIAGNPDQPVLRRIATLLAPYKARCCSSASPSSSALIREMM